MVLGIEPRASVSAKHMYLQSAVPTENTPDTAQQKSASTKQKSYFLFISFHKNDARVKARTKPHTGNRAQNTKHSDGFTLCRGQVLTSQSQTRADRSKQDYKKLYESF